MDDPEEPPAPGPTSPAFATLDGNWEVQVQYIDHTDYSRFTLKQSGQTISGAWIVEKETFPLEGTYDGRLFKFTVKQPNATLSMSGFVETATDMVGIIDRGKGDTTAFTATHRTPQKPLFRRR
jgi:penicillin-binding protein-related factor A (putative recombinase)